MKSTNIDISDRLQRPRMHSFGRDSRSRKSIYIDGDFTVTTDKAQLSPIRPIKNEVDSIQNKLEVDCSFEEPQNHRSPKEMREDHPGKFGDQMINPKQQIINKRSSTRTLNTTKPAERYSGALKESHLSLNGTSKGKANQYEEDQ